jgi:ATP-dependent Clp protease ATP-binding subunit ClpC
MSELTEAAELALRVAALEAQRGLSDAINVDHLLIGLLSLEKLLEPAAGLTREQLGVVRTEHDRMAAALARASLDPAAVRRSVRSGLPAGQAKRSVRMRQQAPQRDPACLATFARAEALAQARGAERCAVLDLLAALLERSSPALRTAIGDPLPLRRAMVAVSTPPTSEPAPAPEPAPATPVVTAGPVMPTGPAVPSILLRYGHDLTAEAEAGRLPPVVGRHDEMLQLVRVLHRRTKNAPVLIGEAGVGKTAVVEGLARRIAEGAVLPGRRIVALSMASVVAGTSYRGQFEERLEEILAALRAHPEVILFLDEIHTIVGAGDADGRLDAASILKPALSRGEIACIGATTIDEYRRHIEADPALERRFQPIPVAEPSPTDTRVMLDGLRPDLERHHGVHIADEALAAAVDLTVQHVPTRRLPDKAVDALDEACARVSVPILGAMPERVTGTGGVETASAVVTRDTVAAVVSGWLGAPLGPSPAPGESDRLADLAARLAERVVGQPEAIRQVAGRVRLARSVLADPERPAAVFLFVGPAGVGKSELALALAELAADGVSGQPGLIRLAMSDLAEPGRISLLTSPLRRQPRTVVLFEDVERAEPGVLGTLRPYLASGRLTDEYGRPVDGRQAIVVLTARLSGDRVGRRRLGFSPSVTADVVAELRSAFGSDLISLIDETVLFRPLGRPELLEIVRRRVATLQQRLRQHHEIELTLSDAALALLADRALAESNGAHAIERIVSRLLTESLGQELLAGRIQRGARLRAEPLNDNLRFSPDRGCH